jgi:hypothetical protein
VLDAKKKKNSISFCRRLLLSIKGPKGCCCKTKPDKVQIDIAIAESSDLTMSHMPIETPLAEHTLVENNLPEDEKEGGSEVEIVN